MNAYIVFYGTRQHRVYANTSLDARDKGVKFFRVPASKKHLVSAHLSGKAGKPDVLIEQVLP